MRLVLSSACWLLLCCWHSTVEAICSEYSERASELRFSGGQLIQRVAISGTVDAFHLLFAVTSSDPFQTLRESNGRAKVIFASPTALDWTTPIEVIAERIRIVSAVFETSHGYSPTLHVSACAIDNHLAVFSSSPSSSMALSSSESGLVAMYENELIIVFRSFTDGLLLFSAADQGDLLIVQIHHGQAQVIFDFGALSNSMISCGNALNDGEWHELRWSHHFDAVHLRLDGVKCNSSHPNGLYRKLDWHNTIYIGGRPNDGLAASSSWQSSFDGCMARLQLNDVDLLAFAARKKKKTMLSTRSIASLGPNASLTLRRIPQLSMEMRLMNETGISLVLLMDERGDILARLDLVDQFSIALLYNDTSTTIRQLATPDRCLFDGSWHQLFMEIGVQRLAFTIDQETVLYLEGVPIRSIASRIASIQLTAPGCFRSISNDLLGVSSIGDVVHDRCRFIDRCRPNPCLNDGVCIQKELDNFICKCNKHHTGRSCHISLLPRSCEQYFQRKNITGIVVNVKLDLDGGEPLKPLSVKCSRDKDGTTIVTEVSHDLPPQGLFVSGIQDPGTVRHSLDYGMGSEQMNVLMEGFEHCEQSMHFECHGGATLMTFNDERRPSSWWGSRHGQHALQWADAPQGSRMCSCAMNASCLNNRGMDGMDEGINSHIQLLPVTELFLGGTDARKAINVSIGQLRCSHRAVMDTVTFSDRNDRLIGFQSLTGLSVNLVVDLRFSHPHMTIFTSESISGEQWIQLLIKDGHLVANVVGGGRSIEMISKLQLNDDEWHSISWTIDDGGMWLGVDNQLPLQHSNGSILLANTYRWIIGSRDGLVGSGYSGLIRNVHLNGKEIILSRLARKASLGGVVAGEQGKCLRQSCRNGGRCVEMYDSFSCNCSLTPFGGQFCEQEIGVSVPNGAEMDIKCQHPAHVAPCFRIGVLLQRQANRSTSLIRAKALFSDATFNITIAQRGNLHLSVSDGGSFSQRAETRRSIGDGQFHDIRFCTSALFFTLTIDGEDSIKLMAGNWSFFRSLNVWKFLDKDFIGCVSRLQVGTAFPLKDPASARFSIPGSVHLSACPPTAQLSHYPLSSESPSLINTSSPGISVHAIVQRQNNGIAMVPAIILGASTGMVGLLLLITVCWVRTRPDGVYKTNENLLTYCSPSEEPLVRHNHNQMYNKEYFC